MTRVRIPLGIVTGIVFGLFDFKSSVILVNRQLANERAGFFFFFAVFRQARSSSPSV